MGYTIRSADKFVYLSVMDFAPVSFYHAPPLWWPALVDALLQVLHAKPNVEVRLLISYWWYSFDDMLGYLEGLLRNAQACHIPTDCSDRPIPQSESHGGMGCETVCTSKLTVKLFK